MYFSTIWNLIVGQNKLQLSLYTPKTLWHEWCLYTEPLLFHDLIIREFVTLLLNIMCTLSIIWMTEQTWAIMHTSCIRSKQKYHSIVSYSNNPSELRTLYITWNPYTYNRIFPQICESVQYYNTLLRNNHYLFHYFYLLARQQKNMETMQLFFFILIYYPKQAANCI